MAQKPDALEPGRRRETRESRVKKALKEANSMAQSENEHGDKRRDHVASKQRNRHRKGRKRSKSPVPGGRGDGESVEMSLSSYETSPQDGSVQLKTGMTVQQLKELTKKRLAATKPPSGLRSQGTTGQGGGTSPQSVAARSSSGSIPAGVAAPKGRVYPPGYVPPVNVRKRSQSATAASNMSGAIAAARMASQPRSAPLPAWATDAGTATSYDALESKGPAVPPYMNVHEEAARYAAEEPPSMDAPEYRIRRRSETDFYGAYDLSDRLATSTLEHMLQGAGGAKKEVDMGGFGPLIGGQQYQDGGYEAFLNGGNTLGNALDVTSPASSSREPMDDADRDMAASVAAQTLLANRGQEESSWEKQARDHRASLAQSKAIKSQMEQQRKDPVKSRYGALQLQVDDDLVRLKRSDSLGDVAPIIENTAFSVAEFVLHTPGGGSPAMSFRNSPNPSDARWFSKSGASPMMRKAMASPLTRRRADASSAANGLPPSGAMPIGLPLPVTAAPSFGAPGQMTSGSTLEEVQSLGSSNQDGSQETAKTHPAGSSELPPPPPPLSTPRGSGSVTPVSSPLQRMRLSHKDVKALGNMTNRLAELPNGTPLSGTNRINPSRFFESTDKAPDGVTMTSADVGGESDAAIDAYA
eukprot:scaffold48_cov311-Pinguiococcus_pyrenoidosus.AAC.35